MPAAPVESPIHTIPTPAVIRQRLAALNFEHKTLRALLRLAEETQRETETRKPARGNRGD
jgi:hypothetical protein